MPNRPHQLAVVRSGGIWRDVPVEQQVLHGLCSRYGIMLLLSPQSIDKILTAMVSSGPFESNSDEPGFRHKSTSSCEKLVLMVRIVCPCIRNIIKNLFSVQAVTFCNGKEPDRAEGTLSIDIKTLSFPSAHIDR